MVPSHVLDRLLALPKFGTGLGMRRTTALLDKVAPFPPPSIGITGSNGKGSVTVMTDSLLRSQGFTTVRHVSPHFLDPNERISLNGKILPPTRFNDLIDRVLDSASAISLRDREQFCRFEILFAAALALASEERVDCAVLEAGIGGRFDPTGLANPDPVAITAVELEHTEVLGPTKELIALDKMDLAAPGGTVILGPLEDDLFGRMEAYAKRRDVRLIRVSTVFAPIDYREDHNGPVAIIGGSNDHQYLLKLPLAGEFQTSNATISLALAQIFVKRISPNAEIDWIKVANTAWRDLSWPGRLQSVSQDPEVVVDAGHTPEALNMVVRSILNWRPSPRILLLGASKSKDWQAIAQVLVKLDAVAVVSRSPHDGVPPDQMAMAFIAAGGRVLAIKEELSQAVDLARTEAKRIGGTVYALGGLFFSADVVRVISGLNPYDAVYL